jgi:hypothetical protein
VPDILEIEPFKGTFRDEQASLGCVFQRALARSPMPVRLEEGAEFGTRRGWQHLRNADKRLTELSTLRHETDAADATWFPGGSRGSQPTRRWRKMDSNLD